MPIRESFDFTFCDDRETMLALEADARDQRLSLKLLSRSGQVIGFYPTRKQWLEFRAAVNHILDAEDVTIASTAAAKGGEPFSNDPIEPVSLGPGPCPDHVRGCPILEDGNSPTGECLECVAKAYAGQETEQARFERWLDKHTLDDTDLNDPAPHAISVGVAAHRSSVRTQAEVDQAIVKHVRDYWRRHLMIVGSEPRTLSFEGELGNLCAEVTAAATCTATLLDFAVIPRAERR